jgi:hypothetical protein
MNVSGLLPCFSTMSIHRFVFWPVTNCLIHSSGRLGLGGRAWTKTCLLSNLNLQLSHPLQRTAISPRSTHPAPFTQTSTIWQSPLFDIREKTANPSPCPSKDRHLPTHSLYADQHPLAISALRSLRENVNCSKLSRERYGPRGDLASTSFVSHWLLTIVLVETIRSASVGREIPKTTPNWPETDH